MPKLSHILSKKPDSNPTIYAYKDTNPQYKGLLKVGYTSVDVLSRVKQQYPTKRPGPEPFKIVLEESAMLSSGSNFTDKDVHKILRKRIFQIQMENGLNVVLMIFKVQLFN